MLQVKLSNQLLIRINSPRLFIRHTCTIEVNSRCKLNIEINILINIINSTT